MTDTPDPFLFSHLRPCVKMLIMDMLTTHLLGKKRSDSASLIATCLALPLTIFIVILIILIRLLIHAPIKLILRLRFPKKYAEFLGRDSFFEETNCHANCVYIVEHSGKFEELYKALRESCNRLYNSHYKFSSTVHTFCGYYYLLKQNVTLDDIVCVQEHTGDFIEITSFKEYLKQHCFDCNSKALWRAFVFNKKIIWGDTEKTYYPIVLRFNHSVGDGMSLFIYLQKYFFNQVVYDRFDKIVKNSQKSNSILNSSTIGTILLQGPKMEYENLNSNNSSQNVVWFVEKEPKYIKMIRALTKQLDCSFTDVIMTAAVSSIAQYLKMGDNEINNLIVYNTARPLSDNINLILAGDILSNEFTINAYKLPGIKNESMLFKFKGMKEILRNGRNSADGQIGYLFQKILSHIHPSILTKFVRYNLIGTTLGVTNIPFADSCFIGEYPVANTLAFVNTFESTKFFLVVLSYNDKLHVTLTSRKYLKTNEEELQRILDKVFENVTILYDELNPPVVKQENDEDCNDVSELKKFIESTKF